MDLCDYKYIKQLLDSHGFKFSKSKGQNFLVAGWVPERMVSESGIDAGFGVLEIGPGVGALTAELARRAGKVAAVEIDRALLPILSETLGEFKNVTLINGDILKLDIRSLAEEQFSGMRPAVCANLPYNITTPILSALVDAGCFESITVMVQREVARRICALPGSPDYGAFSVYIRYHTEPSVLFDIPPDCYIPRPKVHSSVALLKPRGNIEAGVKNEKLFFQIVRAAFAQRRKILLNGLHSRFQSAFSREDIAGIIEKSGLDPKVRGETLGIEQFAEISNHFEESGRC
jgi:16S rRNA (adenine1518-N6/adenine1519-N6)-dimethyltransferase